MVKTKRIPTRRRKRASTLVTVLVVLVILASLGTILASALMSHYNLAVRYRDTARAEGWAQAGLQEFIQRSRELQAGGTINTAPPALLPQFRGHEVLMEAGPRLPATVRLLLDGPHDSRDNSLSPMPARSCFDGAGATSIPPFSYDVVLEVVGEGRRYLFEALVQQRWPYAVAAPGSIRVLGGWRGLAPNDQGQVNGSPPAEIQGEILAMEAPVIAPTGSTDAIEMSDLFGLLAPFSHLQGDANTRPLVQIGGGFEQLQFGYQRDYEGTFHPTILRTPVSTQGGLVEGDIHLLRNASEPPRPPAPGLSVDAASAHRGELREDYRLGGRDPRNPATTALMARMFEFPDLSGWTPVDDRLTPYLSLYDLTSDVILTSHPERQSQEHTIYVPGGRAFCRENLQFATHGRLVLDDCSLACAGNVVISAAPGAQSEVLRGTNATLIVKGMLRIDGGRVDAGGNGMVIIAGRFFLRASGSYNGLLVGREGGAFFGQSEGSQPGLHIRGGVLLGAQRTTLAFPNQVRGPEGELNTISNPQPDMELRTFTVAGTRIEYAPQYLRGLNQFGGLHAKAMIRRQ